MVNALVWLYLRLFGHFVKFHAYKPNDFANIRFRQFILECRHPLVLDAFVNVFINFGVIEFLDMVAGQIVRLYAFPSIVIGPPVPFSL